MYWCAMIEILGRSYITDKEAAIRYGYSQRWFIKKRFLKAGPPYAQMGDKGRVLYDLEQTDMWFNEMMKNNG